MNLFRKKLIIKYYYPLKKEDAECMFKKIPNNFPKYFLSIPKTMRKPVKTVRCKTLTIECDNLGTVLFSSDKTDWKDSNEFFTEMEDKVGKLNTVQVKKLSENIRIILL